MEDDNVVSLKLPGEIDDPLSEVLRDGARSLLMQAVEAEVSVFLASRTDASPGRWPPPFCASRSSATADGADRHRRG